MDTKNEFVTVEELAERFKVSPRTIQRLVERKELKALRIGKQIRFKREWVEHWIEQNSISNEEKLA